MRLIAILVLFIGVGLAGGAVYYMYGQFRAAEEALRRQTEVKTVPVVTVVVANENLTFGKRITKDHVRLVEWPKAAAPPNAFNELSEIFSANGESRTVLRRMEPNEAVLKSKVTGFGEDATVAALLEPGMRAFTMRVDASSSVAGFILPGSRVDISLTHGRRGGNAITQYLLQNVEVIAIDQDTDPDRISARVPKTVTLQVTPRQVQQLNLAQNIGKLSLSLRGFGSTEEVEVGELDRRELLNEYTAAPAPEEVAPTVRIRRGVKASRTEVEDPDAEESDEDPDEESEERDETRATN